MCGISGIWRFADFADDSDMRNVQAMISAMVHRGPDGEGFFQHENLALVIAAFQSSI
jgi:asparagine synthetase B (glutamine-hydrolysing)